MKSPYTSLQRTAADSQESSEDQFRLLVKQILREQTSLKTKRKLTHPDDFDPPPPLSLFEACVKEFLGNFFTSLFLDGALIGMTLVNLETQASYNIENANLGLSIKMTFPSELLLVSAAAGSSFTVALLLCHGAVLNPLFTIALATITPLTFTRAFILWLPQILGSFLGHIIAYTCISAGTFERLTTVHIAGAENPLPGTPLKSAAFSPMFAVQFPPEEMSNTLCFFTSFLWSVITVILILPAFAKPSPNRKVNALITGVLIFFVTLCSSPFGCQSDSALFHGSLLMMCATGWNSSIIRQHGDYWWILIVVTPLAGVVGGILSGMIIVWEWKKEGRIESFSGEIQKLLPAYGKVTGEPRRMPR